MDLNEVLIFVRVVQTGSFNKAAERLEMPNSTVSTKVSALEKRLGVTLLHRTTRKLNLTQIGEAFYQNALKHIEGLVSAESEAALNQGEPCGKLRITAPVLFANEVLPEIICLYSKKYPRVDIEVIASDNHLDLISENIDIALRGGKLPDSSLKSLKLGTGYFLPYASPAYIKAHPKISHPKDLLDHTCIQFCAMNTDKWEFTNSAKVKIKVPMKKRLLMSELVLVRELAAQGLGVALLPPILCPSEIKEKKLVRILSDWKSESRDLHFVFPADKYVSPKLSSFISLATGIIKKRFADAE